MTTPDLQRPSRRRAALWCAAYAIMAITLAVLEVLKPTDGALARVGVLAVTALLALGAIVYGHAAITRRDDGAGE